jgi:hypothetical protein
MAWNEEDDFEHEEEEEGYEEGLVFVGMCFNGKENEDRWSAIKGVYPPLENIET